MVNIAEHLNILLSSNYLRFEIRERNKRKIKINPENKIRTRVQLKVCSDEWLWTFGSVLPLNWLCSVSHHFIPFALIILHCIYYLFISARFSVAWFYQSTNDPSWPRTKDVMVRLSANDRYVPRFSIRSYIYGHTSEPLSTSSPFSSCLQKHSMIQLAATGQTSAGPSSITALGAAAGLASDTNRRQVDRFQSR